MNDNTRQRRLARWALAAVAFAFVVIALGAVTRLSDAGLGCPDWPGCYGHLAVPTSTQAIQQIDKMFPTKPLQAHKAWAEMIHRYCAGTLALLIAVVVFFAIREAKRLHSKKRMALAIALLLLLIYQPLLGMWTVTWKLLPIVVSQHLLGGFGLVGLLWAHYCLYSRPGVVIPAFGSVIPAPEPGSSQLKPLAIIALILVIFQIMLGAWTSTNYAAISCASFPFCQMEPWHWDFKQAFNLMAHVGRNYDGGLLTDDAKRTIQMVHRMGALIVTTYLLFFAGVTAWRYQQQPRALRLVMIMLGLLILQVCLGVANVMLARPLVIAVLHNLTAASLLLSVITVNIYIQRHAAVTSGDVSYA